MAAATIQYRDQTVTRPVRVMRVLLLDGYSPDDADHRVVVEAVEELHAGRHEVDLLAVHGFNPVMSAAERAAYHSDQPVISEDVRDSATRLQAADALLFCYPTMAFNVPASLKGWLERVMVPGVAFVFDHEHRVRPGMQNIRRIGAVTTSPHSRVARTRARDAGKRTTARTLRLSAHKRCRTTFVSVPTPVDDNGIARIRKALHRW
ncbi:MAG: NAD(P)H-dependent oxidoreductase [Acidimicrobiaceae bacterium]|nr:NAD(P)H-dependent oxidoreductase [Acidimicrobiaceae bacterium]MXZ66981.1 NAD(P)H-dependent oxidoreductase [Acidimicrobiaceae bacterium]MYA15012.1 NAD(P)H-dependent oxidoreductase [Acidimicrobiaceae bacterium]MYE56092.1 NAD(P)H-dependent oxidoreductase [Acidimicrobiaceae bacterium]MYE65091.1 NAD(P)H-dependent oxidoreductase [Acidimicrobiaceae bacterium]